MKIVIFCLIVFLFACENKKLNLNDIQAIEFNFTNINKEQIKKLYYTHKIDTILNSFYTLNQINADSSLNQELLNKLELLDFYNWEDSDLAWQNRPEIISITLFTNTKVNITKTLNNRDLDKFESIKKLFY
jgi:hypothetical protein